MLCTANRPYVTCTRELCANGDFFVNNPSVDLHGSREKCEDICVGYFIEIICLRPNVTAHTNSNIFLFLTFWFSVNLAYARVVDNK